MTDRTVEVPAGTIHYRELGPSDGRPVVFVHGFLIDGSLWAGVAERVAEQGLRAIVPTWPLASHPEAMNEGVDLSPRGVARIVLDVLEELRLDDVVLVGNDTGGAICQLTIDTDHSRVSACSRPSRSTCSSGSGATHGPCALRCWPRATAGSARRCSASGCWPSAG